MNNHQLVGHATEEMRKARSQRMQTFIENITPKTNNGMANVFKTVNNGCQAESVQATSTEGTGKQGDAIPQGGQPGLFFPGSRSWDFFRHKQTAITVVRELLCSTDRNCDCEAIH